MILAVIFDMFETLISHYTLPGDYVYFGAQMAEDAGVPKEEFLLRWRATNGECTLGRLSMEQMIENLLREFDCYSEELLEKMIQKRTAVAAESFHHLHPEIIPMFETLKEQGMMVALISNCFSEEASVIRQSVLFPYFDALCLSYEVGMAKPDKAIYQKCMDELGVKPEECLYVGDGGSRELETARELGMTAVQATWYLKKGSTQPAGRKPEFPGAERPMEILEYIVQQG